MNELLEKLNPDQLKPVVDTEGAVLVLAGAGSGKTRVLTSRIAYLIEEKGVFPSNILAITFTNKAAKEMQERLSDMVDTRGMWVCTIHSMCVRMLRQFAEKAGLTPNFSIYAESERANVIKKTFTECGLADEKLLKNTKYHIANAKMLGQDPDTYERENRGYDGIESICKVYTLYQKHLRDNNALDFDDLLIEALKLLQRDKEALDFYAQKFRYILVDEFQDTNSVQFEIIKHLASFHGNLFAVGDDDQSIYGWRGAKIENILNFNRSFAGAKTYKLEQNYRSTKTILSLANEVIKHNGMRKEKTLWTENEAGAEPVYYQAGEEADEALYTAQTIARAVEKGGAKFSDFAVLMRINALTRSYEQEFAKYGIPYKVFGGFRFFERKEIKDLLAYFRIINNPFDSEAITRIINFPRRGIGEKTISALEEYAEREELSVYDALFDLDELPLNARAKSQLKAFKDLIKDLVIQGQALPIRELVRYLIAATRMRDAFAEQTDENMNKLANIDEFVNAIDEFARLNPEATLTDYLNQVTLSSDTDEMDETDYVTLATIHSVKGLEFKQVFLCGLEDGIMPSSRSRESKEGMEEERRLMYVAITRAREKIYFTRSKTRFLYGSRSYTMPSVFLQELSPVLKTAEEEVSYSSRSSYGYGGGGRGEYASRGGFGGSYGGYDSAPRRFAYQKKETDDSYFQTFGSRKKTTQAGGLGGLGGFSAPSQKPSGGKDLSAFRVGVKVEHTKFGTGTIIATKGEGNNLILNVAFEGMGIKQLSAALAPIKII